MLWMETYTRGERMKKNKYNIGDMFTISHGDGLYRGIICEIDKDVEEYNIFWTYPNQIVKILGYNKYEIQTNIGQGNWRYYPVVK